MTAEDSSVSEMTKDVKDQIPTAIAILIIIGLIGSVGNMLVLFVYSRKKDNQTSTVFILVLAIADSLTCLIVVPFTIVVEHLDWQISNDFVCKTYYLLNNTGIPFSCLLISAIALDRYFCICHPFWRVMTVRRAKIVIGALAVFSLVFGTLSTLQIGTRLNRINATEIVYNSTAGENETIITEKLEYECLEKKKSKKTFTLFERILYEFTQKGQTVIFILCILFVIVLYVCIYRSVLRIRKKKEKLKGGGRLRMKPPPPVKASDGEESTTLKPAASAEEGGNNEANSSATTQLMTNSGNDIRSSTEQPTADILPQNNNTTTATNKDHVQNPAASPDASQITTQQQVRHAINFQNMRTAAMLFVVAVVYILTFLPACLMANKLVDMYLPVFYLYYLNNAANPIIYCFMNENFRTDVRVLLCSNTTHQHRQK